MITETLEHILEIATREEPDPRAHPLLAEDIRRFTQNLLDGKEIGLPGSAA